MPNRRGLPRNALRRLTPLLLGAIALLFTAARAYARAGGGGSYHSSGGSHSSSGHGGSGGGGGELIFDLIFLLFSHPGIGFPVLLLIVLFFYFSAKQGNSSYQSSVIRRGTLAMRDGEKADALRGLRAHDPNFDEAALCARVSQAFLKIQTAWCAQNLAAVRAFISDGVFERFQLQFAEQKAEGYHDRMEDVRVEDVGIVSVSSEGLFDELAVRVRANARDWRESLDGGRVVSGTQSPEEFAEVWTFLRHRTATTDPAKSGLMEGHCPNCGAPIELNQSATCAYCKAMLRSGAYDWVLAEITQEVEWQVPSRAATPGVAAMRQRDPEFDTVSIEDRASVMFWRKATADRVGKIDPLRKMASPEFAARYAASLKGGPRGRLFAGDCAVGSVETVGVIGRADRDLALAMIKWSGKQFAIDVADAGDPNARPRDLGQPLWAATLFVLSRAAGVKTDLARSISSAHCPNCGAPESGGLSNACESCGTVLNDGRHGWVLDEIMNQDTPAAGLLMAELQGQAADPSPLEGAPREGAPPDGLALLAWVIKVATADGNIDPREHEQIATFAANFRVPPEQVQAMIAAGFASNLAVRDPRDATEARAWLSAMAAAAWADGKMEPEEAKLMTAVGARAGLSAVDVNQIIAGARARLFQNASAALRTSQR